MILLKKSDEIELMKQSSLLVSKTLAEVAKHVQAGISTLQLDKIAEQFIRDNGGIPGFLGYKGFPKTLCTSVNEQVVHGIPSKYELKEGDIISIDCGVILNGFYGDSAYTFEIGEVTDEVKSLLKTTKEALYKGIENAVEGNRVGDISQAIQQHAEEAGYSVVRELVGHGIGKNMHEAPEVPNFGKNGRGSLLKKGMVICIEPMINMRKRHILTEKDGWTIRTVDKAVSAHYEHAVAIDKGQPIILSTFEYIEEVINKK
ncbi:MAG: type I methionyl aminopeptidase [bacterium]